MKIYAFIMRLMLNFSIKIKFQVLMEIVVHKSRVASEICILYRT